MCQSCIKRVRKTEVRILNQQVNNTGYEFHVCSLTFKPGLLSLAANFLHFSNAQPKLKITFKIGKQIVL
jgi:hypothetical protein